MSRGGNDVAEQGKPPETGPNRWKYATAALIVVVMLGLVVYMTVTTGEIPYQIAIPLLGAALWALYNFQASGTNKGS